MAGQFHRRGIGRIALAATAGAPFVASGQGITEVMAVSGTAPPDGKGTFLTFAAPDGNGVFGSFAFPALNTSGQVAFWAILTGTNESEWIFVGSDGNVTQVARTGVAALVRTSAASTTKAAAGTQLGGIR